MRFHLAGASADAALGGNAGPPAPAPGAGRGAETPAWRVAGQEDRRQGKDEHEPRNDETKPTQDGAGRPPQPPGTIDRQLRRGWARQKVRGRDGILELFGVYPRSLLDAHATEQGDMGGRSPEPDATQTEPLTRDGDQRHPRHGSALDAVFVASHQVSSPRTSSASPRSRRLLELSVLRPLAVATSRGRTCPTATSECERMSPSAFILCVARWSDPGPMW